MDVLPEKMRRARRWLLWRKEGEGRKVPYYVDGTRRTGVLDSPEDRSRLGDLGSALDALSSGRFSGLGFALGPDGEEFWQGIDFDHIPDNPMLQGLAGSLPGYVETSPSGNGLHAIGLGREFRTLGSNASGIEAYCKGRYFTVTGVDGRGDVADLAEYVEKTLAPLHSTDSARERPADGDSFFAKVNTKALGQLSAWVPIVFPKAHTYHDGYRISSKALGRGLEEDISILPQGARDFGEERGVTPIDLVVEWGPAGNAKEAAFWLASKLGVDPQILGWRESNGSRNGSDEPIEQNEENQEDTEPSRIQLAPTEEEWAAAKLTPKCIVHNYLYADVGQIIAPGGTGKTTLLLYEAVCIALGRDIWGLRVECPGWTLIVSKEDQRERLIARLRAICEALELSREDTLVVRNSVIVRDVTGNAMKLLFLIEGNIHRTTFAQKLVGAHAGDPPVQVIFDPTISFGASESMVNDNEDALVQVARYLVGELDCCVRYVHHTGKANARASSVDQYSGRGGTAMPDGSRMTSTLMPAADDDITPQGCSKGEGVSILKLERHKVSYAPPNLPTIWIRRERYEYQSFYEYKTTPEEQARSKAGQVWRFLSSRLERGERYSARALRDIHDQLNMRQRDIPKAVAHLEAVGRVEHRELDRVQGRKRTYLHPVNGSESIGA